MVKPPSFDRNGIKKGAWSEEEDNKLRAYVLRYGHWNWRLLPKYAGLARCGKSCRLRWVNYLKPGVKKGNFSEQEEDLIVELHHQLGNKWSAIASRFPGRTDNDIKNFWHTRIQKRRHRSEAANYDKVTMIEQTSEASSKGYHHQVLEEQKVAVREETRNHESGWLSATNYSSSQSSDDADLWPSDDIFQLADNTDYCAASEDNFPPLLEEEFFNCSQLHCSEFSSSESAPTLSGLELINADDGNSIVSSDYVGDENLWTGSFASDHDTSNYHHGQSGCVSLQDQVGGFYDPLIYFDHGMNLFS